MVKKEQSESLRKARTVLRKGLPVKTQALAPTERHSRAIYPGPVAVLCNEEADGVVKVWVC